MRKNSKSHVILIVSQELCDFILFTPMYDIEVLSGVLVEALALQG